LIFHDDDVPQGGLEELLAIGPERAQPRVMRWPLAPLLLLAAPAIAGDKVQTLPSPAPPPPTLADELAFGKNGPRMTVPVQIAEAGPFPFIIDTGAQRTVISRQLADHLQLSEGPTVQLTAMTGTRSVGTVVIPRLSVSSIGGSRIEAPALDTVNLGAPGMLGIDTLQDHAVTIDFDRQIISVRPSVKLSKKAAAAHGDIVVMARSLFGQLIVTDAYCGNQRIKVVLDTGSVVTIGNMALRRRVGIVRKAISVNLLSVTGGTLPASYTAIRSVKIGGMALNDLPIAFADAPPFKQFGLENTPAIMLGMDALRLFRRVEIDFANRAVRFTLPGDTQGGEFLHRSAGGLNAGDATGTLIPG
jgi:predicted aspartyl protease